jgi:hypothetical protein
MTAKLLPSLLMAAGSLLLAWRVKTLIDALMMAQRGAETNFRSITEFLAGQQTELPMIGFQQHVERSQSSASGSWFSASLWLGPQDS